MLRLKLCTLCGSRLFLTAVFALSGLCSVCLFGRVVVIYILAPFMCIRIDCNYFSSCMCLIILTCEELLALCRAGGFLGDYALIPIVSVRIYRDFCISTLNGCLMTAVTLVICAVSGLGAGGIFRIMVSYTICAMIIGIKRKFFVAALCNRFTVVTNSVSAVSRYGTGACSSFDICCINMFFGIKRDFLIRALKG